MGALSKGCRSCTRRKVKCDEARPKCTRCRNAGIECTGFAQRLRFVDETSRIHRSLATSYPKSQEFSTGTSKSSLVHPPSLNRRAQPPRSVPLLANTLPLTSFKDNIFLSYLLAKLFEGECSNPSNSAVILKCGLPTDWIPELIGTSQNPRHKSWDALAALVFGQAHKSYDEITNAHRLYGQALSELRNRLSNSTDRRTDSTLASMTALYTYEILVSKSERGWMSHADGLGWLLESRGPWQQKIYAGKSIFLEHRIMLVVKSIISRQRTFLRHPTWKTVPWEDDPATKSAIDYLVDIGADIAENVAQIQTLGMRKSCQELEYSQLRAQVAKTLEELNTWWHEWETEHPEPAMEVPSNLATIQPVFPTRLEYDMMLTAFMICTYDAMRILLLQLWYKLQQCHNSNDALESTQQVVLDMPNKTALLGITSDIHGLACEILRSLEYAYRMSTRFISTFSFLFIQDVAYGCFDRGSREAIWVVQHGWAERGNVNSIEDANLLKRLLPLGQIKA